MKAILVARVSTEEQREANNSLPAQMTRMEDYCKRCNFEILERFSFDESAYKEKRDEFDRILAYIDAQEEKIAVCFDKVDRLSRDIFDKRVPILYNKAVEDTIELHFVSDGQVIDKKMSAGDKFMFGTKLWLSKYFSDAISDNVRRAFEHKRRNWETTWPAKLGYINIRDAHDKSDVIPDPERSHLVVKMFQLYATGEHSYDSIRKVMFELWLRSKKWKMLHNATVEAVLKNPFYYWVCESKYGDYNHKYPRLISKELFDRCQDVRRRKYGRPEKITATRDFVFWGVLKCEKCGCSITPELKRKKSWKEYVYYSCTNGKEICTREYVNENELLCPIHDILRSFTSIPEGTFNKLLNELRNSNETDRTFSKAQIGRLQRDLKQAQIEDENLIRKFCDPSTRITPEIYDRLHQENQDKITQFENSIKKYSEEDSEYETTLEIVISLATRAKEIFESSEVAEKRMFVRLLLQNPTLDGKKPLFHLQSPFHLVAKLNKSENWQGGWESNSDQGLWRSLY